MGKEKAVLIAGYTLYARQTSYLNHTVKAVYLGSIM